MKLQPQIREFFKSDRNKMLLALELNVSLMSIKRWIMEDGERLTTIRAIRAISKLTGADRDSIFIEK